MPQPIKSYRKVLHDLISEYYSKNFGHYEGQIKLDGFSGATMEFTSGLARDLPRGVITSTLKLILNPLGSVLECLEAIDYNNPDNLVNQIRRAGWKGDSFSIGRIVGNVTGQVALAFTPAITKKFSKVFVELDEAQIVEVKPWAVSIAKDTGVVAREVEGASSDAKVVGETGISTNAEAPRADFYVKPSGEPLVPTSWMIHGEPRNLRVYQGKQGKHMLWYNNHEVTIIWHIRRCPKISWWVCCNEATCMFWFGKDKFWKSNWNIY